MGRSSIRSMLVAWGAALGLAAAAMAAIDRGAIQGTITDQQGSVIPGARVTVKNLDTNVEVNLTTNSAGFYLASELVPGHYSVHISASSFSAVDQTGIVVRAGVTTTADAQLKVGATTQAVEVTAAAPLVESTASNFTTMSLGDRYTQELPLPGRDIQALVQLVPGITQASGPSGVLFGFNSDFGNFPDPTHLAGSNVSANGGQGGANAWYLDGSLNSVLGAEQVAVNPLPDAVAEFNVINNGLAAEHGWTSGAVFNVVLKSGTNAVHGDLYDYNRNSYFSATNPFARRDAQGRPFLQPSVNFNDFGGTVGGPVYLPHLYNGKNRTFFFFSWDISLLHETKPQILTVPVPAERAGDFTADPSLAKVCTAGVTNCLYDPYTTTGPDPTTGQFTRTAFTTPVIPAKRIDPLAAFYLASFPNPNYLDPLQQNGGCTIYCNNFFGDAGSSLTTHNLSTKIDHAISDKHKLFGEWLFNPSYYANFRYPWYGPTAQTQTGLAGAEPFRNISQIYALGLTSTFTPTLVNEVRLNFTRQVEIPSLNPDSQVATSAVQQRVKGLNFFVPDPPTVAPNFYVGTTGGSLFWGPQAWQNAINGGEAITLLDNLIKIIDRHTLKAGFVLRRDRGFYLDQGPAQLNFYGDLTNNPATGQGGNGLAQFLLGAVEQGSFGDAPIHSRGQKQWYHAFYGQDDFRIKPNFTLNIGLRWDFYGWPYEDHNFAVDTNLNQPNPQVPFLGRAVYLGTPDHPNRAYFSPHNNDLAPRLNFSWSPYGSRKTVIRGGYDIVYSNAIETAMAPQITTSSQDCCGTPLYFNGDYTFKRPAFQLSQGVPPVVYVDPAAQIKQDYQWLGLGINHMTRGSKDPYVQQWSLYFERQLPGDMMLSVGYVGSRGEHLFTDNYRNLDHVATATRLRLRNNLNNSVPINAALGPVYNTPSSPNTCPPDATLSGMVDCPGSLVLRPFPQYSAVTSNLVGDGFSIYHSLQAKFEKRYSHGLDIIAAYTIQKTLVSQAAGSLLVGALTPSIFNSSSGRTGLVPGGRAYEGVEDPDNRRRYNALSVYDIPQMLNLAATYELPAGRGKHFLRSGGMASGILGGWKLTQNWNIQSGVPLEFYAPCNAVSCKPNLIGDPSSGRGSKNRQQLENQYFNPAAFTAPFGSDPTVISEITTGLTPQGNPVDFNKLDPYWQFGNAGLHLPTGRSPGFWSADMTLTKEFHLTESRYFQFRWELFNAFNHQNLSLPSTSWCLPPNPDGSVDAVHQFGCQFGKITGIQTDPRSMEFALKLYW